MSNATFLPIGTWLASRQYCVVKHLGEGGFGKTYLVENRLGEKKVVKEFFISSMCMRDEKNQVTISVDENKMTFEQQREKFEKEALLIFSLSNPHVVKVSAVFDENNTIYYVMDYIEGGSLNDKLKSGEVISADEIQRYLGQLLDVLEYIHSKNMLHLDVKPSNIMLDAKGDIVLIDFGTSKVFDSSILNKTINTTRPPYTPGYAPYEQENGDVKYIGPHCDIYSLGATLYRLYSGKKPPMPIEILMNGLDLPSTVSPVMQQVLKKSMTFKMDERIKNVAEFRKELKLEIKSDDEKKSIIVDNNEAKTIIQAQSTPIVIEKKVETKEPETKVIEMKVAEAKVIETNKPKIDSFVETVNGVTFKMRAVEGGSFMMGAQSENPEDVNYVINAWRNESPIHNVTLDDYYIGEMEVTQELWEVVMGNNPSNFKCVNKPVETISWEDCQEFIQRLNVLTGRNFRLPTEAEWEYAARGGKRSQGYKYPGGNNIGTIAWYGHYSGFGNSGGTTHCVGVKQANELGVYDMGGNVCEWCSDWYGTYPSTLQENPLGPETGSDRVLRGGSWNSHAQYCRVTSRERNTPNSRSNNIGFRLACSR